MEMTACPISHSIRPWIVAMAMFGSLFLATRWTEILSTRFEFQPVIPSYTALCAKASSHDLSFVKAMCRDRNSNEQSSN